MQEKSQAEQPKSTTPVENTLAAKKIAEIEEILVNPYNDLEDKVVQINAKLVYFTTQSGHSISEYQSFAKQLLGDDGTKGQTTGNPADILKDATIKAAMGGAFYTNLPEEIKPSFNDAVAESLLQNGILNADISIQKALPYDIQLKIASKISTAEDK